MNTGVGSCAAALRDSMTSYQAVTGGDAAELGTAKSIVGYGATNCEVASNESLSDFASYQVTESLASLHLTAADNDVITWAFDATAYQQDVLTALADADAPAARATAEAALGPAWRRSTRSGPPSTPSGTRPGSRPGTPPRCPISRRRRGPTRTPAASPYSYSG